MGQQKELGARRLAKDFLISRENVGRTGRFGQRERYQMRAACLGQMGHCVLHLVIIDVGHDYGIAGTQWPVIDDKRIECLGSAVGQCNLPGGGPQQTGDRLARAYKRHVTGLVQRIAQEEAVVPVHPFGLAQIFGMYRARHRTVVRRVEVCDRAIDIIKVGEVIHAGLYAPHHRFLSQPGRGEGGS
ncbi:hypothetical protein BSY18_4094 (plasmid) [Blastomonas sp. RAC04]|nr:hypothetical protein BSY18_4094 [Blastomonas sp. RAC04]